MDKEQALDNFWNSFGIPAYNESSIPKNAELPYITYSVSTGSLGDAVGLTATVWYHDKTWANVTHKKDEISEYIGYGGKVLEIDNGYIWLCRNSTFAQQLAQKDDDIKAYYLQLKAQFLTEN